MSSEDFDAQLQRALRRRDPSAGFAERVIARASKRSGPSRLWLVSAVAAMLLIGILANREYQQHRAEEARRQALVALRITAEKLNTVRSKMLRLEVKLEPRETENP
jgi:hypothetical protein